VNTQTRVVLDLNGAGAHSVYVIYNPYRIVIDIVRLPAGAPAVLAAPPAPLGSHTARAPLVLASNASRTSGPTIAAVPPQRPPSRPDPAPSAPPHNSNGGFSLARQLGLGVTRIVIDPGHGGHDPGRGETGSPKRSSSSTSPRGSKRS
jgi:N-acetylmuramoyl-L-alanine amidase